jgi:hypothetical protein
MVPIPRRIKHLYGCRIRAEIVVPGFLRVRHVGEVSSGLAGSDDMAHLWLVADHDYSAVQVEKRLHRLGGP